MYAIGFTGAAALDVKTPLGVADWLSELMLVWAAVTWGGPLEMVTVAAAGTATTIVGLWSSPATLIPFGIGALNRFAAIAAIWTMVHVARARRTAEGARAKLATEIKILQGLLPICTFCKSIRDRAGRWHRLESYLTSQSEAKFTHTYCPPCVEKHFPEIGGDADPLL